MQYVTINNPSSHSLPSIPPQYAYKCFPVRKFKGINALDGGAWVVEQHNEQLRQIKLNHLYYQQRLLQKSEEKKKELTSHYLLSRFHCRDPLDLCALNISSEDLYATDNSEDFSSFRNVASIEASDNHLNLDIFHSFPNLEELYLQLNQITCIHITHQDFSTLHKLDLSYNHLKEATLLELGKLKNLKKLAVRGCGFKYLPSEMSRGYLVTESDNEETRAKSVKKTRYLSLTHLDLSENKLTDISTFASLAGLRRLMFLNLSENLITGVPHLRLMVAQRHFSTSTTCVTSPTDVLKPSIVNTECSDVKDDSTTNHKSIDNVLSQNVNSPEFQSVEEESVTIVNKGRVIPICENVSDGQDKETGKEMVRESKFDSVNTAEKTRDETSDKEIDEETSDKEIGEEFVNKNSIDSIGDVINDNDIEENKTESQDNNKTEIEEENSINDNQHSAEIVSSNINEDILENIDAILESTSNDGKDDVMNDQNDVMNIDFGKELNFGLVDENAFDDDDDDDEDDLNLQTSRVTEGKDNNELFPENDVKDEIKRPFLSLTSLDLSSNQIAEEESLLALTAWPALQDLKLWNNPIINLHKGVPPILYHHLEQMCGVKIVRKTPDLKSQKPRVKNAPNKNMRRIKADLPPIKRNNLVMIEAQIHKAVKENELSRNNSANGLNNEDKNEEHENEANDDQTFFITQTNEVGIDPILEDFDEEIKLNPLDEQKEFTVDEILRLDESVPDDMELPDTVQGSVVALKYMLNHPLQLNRGTYANNFQTADDMPKSKKPTKQRVAKKVKESEKNVLNDALENIKLQNNTHRENLATVLNEFQTNENIRKIYPNVNNMVKSVQKKYDKVRLQSLQPIMNAQIDLQSQQTRANKPSQDLLLSRMKQRHIGDMYSAGSRSITPRSRLRDHMRRENVDILN